MIVTCDLAALPIDDRAALVSVGVFDGVHLGHQAILARNVALARERGLRSSVVTFREHPKQLLLGRAPRTLTTLAHRLELFRRAGIEHSLVLAFNDDLRETSAEEFVARVLVGGLHARAFVLGFDSKFGAGRRGTPELLMQLGFPVEVVPKVVVAQRAVSSTAIREAVELGDLEGAARSLGRLVSVFGTVVEGERLGRTLGFPTANLDLAHELHPPPGVYACWVRIADGDAPRTEADLPAVANIGFRPTVAGAASPEPAVEVHLLDFAGDLYGRSLELEFVRRLRDEQRFRDIGALREQIARDIEQARAVLRPPRTPKALEVGGRWRPPSR